MQQNRARVHPRMKERDENPHQQRIAEDDGRAGQGIGNDFRRSDGIGHRRHGEKKSDNGPGESDVEQRAARGDRRANANECAESSEKRRRGEEVRIAHVNAVKLAGEIMSQLVRQQNGEQREGKRNAEQQQPRMQERVEEHGEKILISGEGLLIHRVGARKFGADGKRGDHREQKQNQRRPRRTARRAHRRQVTKLRETALENFDGDAAVAVAAVVVKAHERLDARARICGTRN